MPTGDWLKGKTKDTDPRVAALAATVKKACNDPKLRARLDAKKKLPPERLFKLMNDSKTQWSLVSPIADYVKLSERNLKFVCPAGHEALMSINDVVSHYRCKVCTPKRNAGSRNPAYVTLDEFYERLRVRYGLDAFTFDPHKYNGVNGELEFECGTCHHVFTKQPRVLLNEARGCSECAKVAVGEALRRSCDEFLVAMRARHGDRYTFHPTPDQKYGNADYIEHTCNMCSTRMTRCVQIALTHGCSTCSQKKKHTTASFIELAEQKWGKGEFDYSLVSYVDNKTHVTLKCKNGHEYQCTPSNHLTMRGCPHCKMKRYVSKGETEWLDALAIPPQNRNVWINVNGRKMNVDTLINATIYEYYGDYWHGNTKRFPADMVNVYCEMTMQELHDHTMERAGLLRSAGYVVIEMWESDWLVKRETRPKPRPPSAP